jgi:hypothetical protein
MKTPPRFKSTLFVVAVTFACGIVCSMSGCGGAPFDLPACQSSPAGATIDTQTCVDYQTLAICRWNAPASGTVVGCITAARSSSGDDAGIECVEVCPPNHYDADSGTSH